MENKKINTAIVGFGLSGKVFHAPFIQTHPSFNLQKIVERNTSNSKEIYPDVEIVTDFNNLINDNTIDLIVLCTPNTFHFPMAKEALLAKKHVVIEKPFTPTTKEADELIAIAHKMKKNIFVYQNRRWDGDFLTIKELLKNKKLGEVYEYEAHFDRFAPELKENWRNNKIPGGGVLYDLGAHLIDQAVNLFGYPTKIIASIKSQIKGNLVDDYFRLELEYPTLKAVLTAGRLVKNIGPRFIIKGSKGVFTKYGMDPQEDDLKKGLMPNSANWGEEDQANWGVITTDSNKHIIKTEPGNYMGFYNNVAEVINLQKKISVKPTEARDVIQLIEQAFEINNISL